MKSADWVTFFSPRNTGIADFGECDDETKAAIASMLEVSDLVHVFLHDLEEQVSDLLNQKDGPLFCPSFS